MVRGCAFVLAKRKLGASSHNFFVYYTALTNLLHALYGIRSASATPKKHVLGNRNALLIINDLLDYQRLADITPSLLPSSGRKPYNVLCASALLTCDSLS